MTEGSGRSAIVLSGGGAYGAYEVGVMKALAVGESPSTRYVSLQPHVVAGTSIGAFNAATALSTPADDFEEGVRLLEDVWMDRISERGGCETGVFRYRGNVFSALDLKCIALNPTAPFAALAEDAAFFAEDWSRRAVNFLQSSADLNQRAIELVDIGTLVTAESFLEIIRAATAPGAIRASRRALRLATTNWRTGEIRVFANQEMTDETTLAIVAAATAIPGIVGSIDIDGEPYADGSAVMNTPLKPAIEAGGDVLHVIYMDPDVQRIPLPRVRNTISAIFRLLVIGFAAVMNRDIELATRINRALDSDGKDPIQRPERQYRKLTIHRYHPREELGGTFKWLSFSRDHIASLIARGFSDASEHDCVVNRCIVPDGADM